MKFTDLASAIQLIANLAVVVSVIFLVIQARLGIRMLKDAAERNHMDKHQSVSRMLAENPQLSELWSRGSKSGLAALSDAERVQFVNFFTYVLRAWEEVFLQHRKGVTNEPMWRAHSRILCDTQPLPGAKDVWGIRRHLFTDEFQAFYDDLEVSGEARPLYARNDSPTISRN